MYSNIKKNGLTGHESKELVQELMRKNGFVVIKNCFTEKQIEDFRYLFKNKENQKKIYHKTASQIYSWSITHHRWI